MKNTVLIALFLLWALSNVWVPWGPGTALAAPKTSLAAQFLRAHILPSYEVLARQSDAMAAPLKQFCARPDVKNRAVVDAAFKDLVLAWGAIEHIRFGPVEVRNIHDRLYFWPDRKGIARRQIEGAVKSANRDVLDPQKLQKKSAALQGLGTLEQLLYGRAAVALMDGSEVGKFRCDFARAVAANISNLVRQEILAKWSDDGLGGYATLFLSPGPDNAIYRSNSEVHLVIVKSYLNGLFHLRSNRLAGPLGLRRGARRKTRAAFAKSGYSMDVMRANIEGLRHLFVEGGLAGWIGKLVPGIDKSVVAEFRLALDHADALSVPLKEAAVDEALRSKLIAIGFPLKNARNLVHQVLSEHTDLPIGINALDGD